MTRGKLTHAVDIFDRRAEAKEVLNELFSRIVFELEPGLDDRPAGDIEPRVRPDQVEVVHVVPITVAVRARNYPRAHVEVEINAALSVSVHRAQANLHHRLGDRAGVAVVGAVHYLQLHSCWRATRRPGWALFIAVAGASPALLRPSRSPAPCWDGS